MKQRQTKPLILIGYRAKEITLYKPQRNKVKVALLVAFVVGCLVTPFTNGLILVAGNVLNKFPLWVYN